MKKWKLITKSCVFCVVFSAAAMVAMTVFFLNREEPANAEELLADGVEMEEGSLFGGEEQKENTGYICIPLPTDCTEDRIQIAEDRRGHKVALSIQNIAEDFFYYHPLSGNNEYVVRPLYGYEDGAARICFELSEFTECDRMIKDGNLYLRFLRPKEMYSRIVVLDAGHGGEDAGTVFYQVNEKDVALDTVLRVGELLEQAGIRVYYTRQNDTAVGTEERIRLVDETQPDMFVSIHCNADSRTRVTKGIKILSKPADRDLAECMAEGLAPVAESVEKGLENRVPVFGGMKVPAVMVQTGYLTNKQEALLLTDEKYLDKMAEGIYNGIMKAYEETDEAADTAE